MMQNNFIIGLTGGSGCGKSVVAKAAVDLGFYHIDTDKLGHEVLLKNSNTYKEIIQEFGEDILSPDREIDRKKLGKMVFSDSSKLEKLNSITHPAIVKKTKELLTTKTIIDGAVIHLTPEIIKMCDLIIAVTNSDERRIKFICERDKIDEETAKKRISSQPECKFYVENADIVIESDCDIEYLYKKSYDVIKRCISEKDI